MDKITEILKNNVALVSDISNHPVLVNNLLGILRNIEANIPEGCRKNFYKNLEVLRIVSGNQSTCSLNAPVISIEEKLLWLADNNKVSENYIFSDVLIEELYHELMHLSSTSYIVNLDSKTVNGFSGFTFDFSDLNISNNLLNGLTEGFTQYLTFINSNSNFSNYDTQIGCVKELIDIVGIDAVKQCYFNNELGMQPIIDRLYEKGMNVDYIYDLEKKCHVDYITHLVGVEKDHIENKTK